MKKDFVILAIETSLDDTCAAVTVNDKVLSNVVASQVAFHEEFGGTKPDVAKRKHMEWIDDVVDEALRQASFKNVRDKRGKLFGVKQPPLTPPKLGGELIDAVAVTYGPGLAPSLEVGVAKAKELALTWDTPLLAVNHMEGHMLSPLAKNSKGSGPFAEKEPDYPLLGLLISGGNTLLVIMKGLGEYKIVGETLDDAAGEAYDKVARMLQLGYPGGPILSELAKEGEAKYELPEPMLHRQDLNFSFSGLKTACMYYLKRNQPDLTRQFCADFAASFQQAVFKMVERRLRRAIQMYEPKMLWLGGGVASNVALRGRVRQVGREVGLKTYIPYSAKLFTDNAAMIGVAGWYQAQRGEFWDDIEDLEREPNLRLGDRG